MAKKKHKRKVSRIVIFTSDAVDAKVKQWKIHPWVCNLTVLVLCVLIGGVIGYFLYEEDIWSGIQTAANAKEEEILLLQEENELLTTEIESLTEKMAVLSETVNQKAQDAETLQSQLEEQSMPTGFPLTGSAAMEEIREGEPICIFTGTENITVVATASGTVLSVEDDETYGHKITVDHGNGYVTIYRNKGDAKVKAGDSVARGTTLYIVGKDNTQLGYQMMKDGAYINPMDVLAISG